MITGAIKRQIDQIWNAFWSGGISNPLEVIEQITYLLFLRRLDDLHTLEENKSARLPPDAEAECLHLAEKSSLLVPGAGQGGRERFVVPQNRLGFLVTSARQLAAKEGRRGYRRTANRG